MKKELAIRLLPVIVEVLVADLVKDSKLTEAEGKELADSVLKVVELVWKAKD